ncbi:HesB/IscA family protein [Lamprocystis purpurea]|jgi:iron-sulfur cluster assembly accessory protein|uniref:HesB/IscA family protein n=1 Tax=Lamprocystis purpurea TaxID=61598 RepID=UPI000368CA40|nr:iron-sulfur cluster assembly accessory protein [Lamprocystis purpurea]
MLTLTPSARKAVSRFIKGNADPVAGVRIAVTGGGCSGLQYGVTLEGQARTDDLVVDCEGLTILIDPASAPMLAGVTVDFQDSMSGSGFKFENPNAASSCGCGKSFSA